MELEKLIERSRRIVFFGGAGVSTASGIPDFRSADGLYNAGTGLDGERRGPSPEDILSATYFALHTKEFYDFYRKHMVYPDAEPNACHRYLYELEKQDKAEEEFCLDQRRDDLDKAERKAFDKKLEDGDADAGTLSKAIRAEKLEKAEAKIDASKKAQDDAAKPAAGSPAPAGNVRPDGLESLLDELGAPAPAAKGE